MRRTAGAAVAVAAAGAVIVAFVAGYGYGRRRGAAPESLAVLGRAPQYTLVNQLGRPVSSSSFRGKVQLVTFLAPYCTGYCPLIAYNFVSLKRVLDAAGLGERVQLVAFNVDPKHTGPATAATFLRQYGWDPHDTSWQYLSGTPEEVRKVVTGGFHIDYQEVSERQQRVEEAAEQASGTFLPEPEVANPLADRAGVDYDVVHNDELVVVDGEGRIRALYDEADRVSDDELMRVIGLLLPGEAVGTPHEPRQ